MYYIVGLGNPGAEYQSSRHNTGRIVLADFLKKRKIELASDKKLKALTGKGEYDSKKFIVVFPETFMNNSGKSVACFIKSKLGAKNLVVIHDDVDLPLGKFKISFGRGSGGHKGVESIMRALKTNEFLRIRVGVSPSTTKGKLKKPTVEKMNDFILGSFKPAETDETTKVSKKVSQVLEIFIAEGKEKTNSGGF